ncbi:MAG: tryptophan dimethylallyltransferase family protein [Myxococcota bacterium]
MSATARSLPGSSLLELGVRRIRGLASAFDFGVPTARLEQRFADAIGPEGRRALGPRPRWSSDITDDGTPFEFSVAFTPHGAPTLRLLFEAQEPETADTPARRWSAAWRTTERLAALGHVDLQRLHAIAPWFEPTRDSSADFVLWHALDLSQPEGEDATLKVYLNPRVHGDAGAPALVERALVRLGHADAWADLVARLARHGEHRFQYLSLDLGANESARTKIYVAHHGVSADRLERVFEGSEGYGAGDATRWCRSVLGGPGPYERRPVLSCFAFSRRTPAPVGTLHLPVRCYAEDDAASARRILAHLPAAAATHYLDAVEAFSARPLGAGQGLQTYASFRRERSAQRLTVYLAPEGYAVPRSETPTTLASIDRVVLGHAKRLATTPFCRRLEGPASLHDFRRFSRGLSFYVMAFQDMLRLCTERVTEPRLERIAATHQREDAGHEQWFVHDLRHVGEEPDLSWLFGPEHQPIRDITYGMLSELHRTCDDRVRLAVVLALEGAGHVFFSRVVNYTERMDADLPLRYFARHHLEVERAHEVFSDDGEVSLEDITLEPEAFAEAVAMVSRIFDGFTRMAADLEAGLSVRPDAVLAEGRPQ